MKLRATLSAILFSGLLSGCSEFKSLWADRYGPDPTLGNKAYSVVREETIDAVVRENQVVTTFLRANGYAAEGTSGKDFVLPGTRTEWYNVILTGFNTVDDACQVYISDLWKFERQKNRIKDVINASGAATAAIIGANSHPSATTLTQLAQAVGLGSMLTGTIGDSYLFAQDPATIGKIVKKLQAAYRNDLANNRNSAAYPIDSYAAVYYHTREYLALCLPPTIQAQIQDLLAKASAVPEGPAPGVTLQQTGQKKNNSNFAGSVKPNKATSAISLAAPRS